MWSVELILLATSCNRNWHIFKRYGLNLAHHKLNNFRYHTFGYSINSFLKCTGCIIMQKQASQQTFDVTEGSYKPKVISCY